MIEMIKDKKLYKLTDTKHKTYAKTQWGNGVTHKAPGEGPLCSQGWIHAYDDPYLAILFNPIHADFSPPVLWEATGNGRFLNDENLKCGVSELTTLRVIELPEVLSNTSIVAFAILVSLEVYTEKDYLKWANNWLNNLDRSYSAAKSAAKAAYNGAYATSANAAASAAKAVYAASAAKAVYNGAYATSAYAAANAAYAAAYASANASANAAANAAEKNLNFKELVQKALLIK